MNYRPGSLTVLLVTLVLSTSCLNPVARRVDVTVNSLAQRSVRTTARYMLVPGVAGVAPTDLQYLEFERYVRHALISRGFVPTSDPAQADIIVLINYGVGEPRTTAYAHSFPILGSPGTTPYPQTFPQVVGTGVRAGTRTVYDRYLILEALDIPEYKKSGKIVAAWRTTVTSTGSIDDLRRVFPVMLAAAAPYLGADTGRSLKIRLRENNRAVLELKKAGADQAERHRE